MHKYESLTGDQILPSEQSGVKEPAKFTYSPLGEAFEKQLEKIENQGGNDIKHLKSTKNN